MLYSVVLLLYCCIQLLYAERGTMRVGCIAKYSTILLQSLLHWLGPRIGMVLLFRDLPEELQCCCARCFDPATAGATRLSLRP